MVEDGLSSRRGPSPRRWPIDRVAAAARMAFDARKVIIAVVGLLWVHLGWSLLDRAFPASEEVTPDLLAVDVVARRGDASRWSLDPGGLNPSRLFEPARALMEPLSALLDPRSEWGTLLHALLGLVWLLVAWGYCGGAIARIASIQEAQSRQAGVGEAVRFAWRSGPTLILATLYPLVALGFCGLTGLAFGLLYRLPAGTMIAGILLVIPLALGVAMALLVAALVAGWPLLHAALASGADDALDALSRTCSYLNQRLAASAVGVAVAVAVGLAGLALVDLLAGAVLRLTQWSLSLAGPRPLIAVLFHGSGGPGVTAAESVHRFWLGAVRLAAHAWVFSYFWTAATLLYLWLRREVDGTPTTIIDRPGQ